jgi:hypothetical protein
MSKDRYERQPRRTKRQVRESVEMMANANFDAVPSLAEAMGNEPMSMTPVVVERIGVNTIVREGDRYFIWADVDGERYCWAWHLKSLEVARRNAETMKTGRLE